MKRVVLYLLFALSLASCCSQPQTLSELKSEYITIEDSIRVHYKIMNSQADAKTIVRRTVVLIQTTSRKWNACIPTSTIRN